MKKMIDFDGNKIVSNLGNYYRPFYTNYSEELVTEIEKFKRGYLRLCQQHLEVCLTSLVKYLYGEFNLDGLPLVSLAVYLNVKVNQKLKELEGVREIFVQPQMGDGGLAIGSACASLARESIMLSFNQVWH